jgi:acyl carrier protein
MKQEEALKWIAGLFEESPDKLTPECLRQDIPLWDSLGVLTLMASLDEKFGILLSDADLRAMQKVDDILAVLRQHGKLDGAS